MTQAKKLAKKGSGKKTPARSAASVRQKSRAQTGSAVKKKTKKAPATKVAVRKPARLRPVAKSKPIEVKKKRPTSAALTSAAPVVQRQKSAARLTDEAPTLTDLTVVGGSKFVPMPTPKFTPTKDVPELPSAYGHDRIVALVRDPYWIHAYWEMTPTSVARAEAAMGQEWPGAKPIIRLVDVTSEDTTSHAEAVVRDVEIHGGTNNWYIDVPNPPRSYRVDLGFRSKTGRFYVSARSNVVSTPKPGLSDKIDENWIDVQEKFERIYAMSLGFEDAGSSADIKKMFEERLKRPLASSTVPTSSSGFGALKGRKFWFHLDAELIVYGATEPSAKVTINNENVVLRPDGTFTLRYSLPDSRQIIPAVARSADGAEERTIVLAVERNTKQLEPMLLENSES
ncbi:MAG TPA: DUF4912 domain-containing protein [Gemmatales bacterium]|nr:DUF4912 domain-containing protein [Gemmatales bacterium]HMP59942.1 DUF4912 domain-containing protein [Gemmatales bacterium]